MERFLDRHDAGRQLARKLSKYANHPDVVILALPRGGVPVAYEVARALKAPLDVMIVRKLGLPGHEELAIGAIASGGIRILNEDIIDALAVDQAVLNSVTKRELEELQRRERQYRGDRPAPEVRDRTVILIDDGLATGASMLAAVHGLLIQYPARIIVAAPAAAPQALNILAPAVDDIVHGISPEPFEGVGKWYENFSQTSDEEVRLLLELAEQQLHN
ncbi:MAG TPA: phosphoribosyltransferase [Anaerolineales bacterium]|nr:phosphoribosyltransferase [Anaerolineales bacterium]